ncbi:hypothetical protein PAXRUDRAFT_823771 [Paxillus rubicundulus Ve08.2h10]|uniref:Uncharacterized protein n=1 Tax=Paxillus rubicundulus Ve08.2h10 TaxID=930991 RepID=A0A0D0EC07_9AGAM|nr:hypothetical protein PAXRUDRAFT_823771 [Paxillus rubicundulus Ve08.2h10]
MRTNIERALNDLIVSNKDTTLANALPAYLRKAGFNETTHDALTLFEHAMHKYLMLPGKSRLVSEKHISGLVAEYWTDKLSAMCAFVCPCSGCGRRISIDPKVLERGQHPAMARKRRCKSLWP